MNNYQLKTEHLGLRILEEKDIEYLSVLESDPEVRRYFHLIAQTQEEIVAKLNFFITRFKETGLPCFLIFELLSNEFVGRIGFGEYKTGEIEVGYALQKKFWGKGYGTESLTCVLNWAKENIHADYIIALALVDHIGSLRVMEKSGMQFYKTGLDEGEECHFYRIKNK